MHENDVEAPVEPNPEQPVLPTEPDVPEPEQPQPEPEPGQPDGDDSEDVGKPEE
jgi:hypothetical protein